MTELEEWRPVVGWEGLYVVSTLGRVRALSRPLVRSRNGVPYRATKRETFLSPVVSKQDAWPRVDLYRPGARSHVTKPVARLVLGAFLGPEFEERAFEFVDGDPGNVAFANIAPHDFGDGEIWKPVPGWDHLYEVSDLGRIRSRPRAVPSLASTGTPYVLFRPARLLKTYLIQATGYPAIVLQERGKKRRSPLHQLVCEAFHGPRPPGAEVCHRDGNRLNARADNLRWGTKADNTRDRIITGFAALAGVSVDQVEAIIANLRMEHNCT